MTAKRFFLDRFEGGFAVLVPEGSEAQVNVPHAEIPTGAREGVWLIQPNPSRQEYTIDEAGAKNRKDDVQNLMDELAGG